MGSADLDTFDSTCGRCGISHFKCCCASEFYARRDRVLAVRLRRLRRSFSEVC